LAWVASGCLYQSVEPDDGNGGNDGGQDVREMDATDASDLGDDVRDVSDVDDDARDTGQDTGPEVTFDEEQSCTDGDDEDRDGLTDCADTDCLGDDPCGRIIFGVAGVTDGNLGNEAGPALDRADALCDELASEVSGLDPGEDWMAVLGNRNDSAKDRVGGNDGYVYNLNNEAVVGSGGNLFNNDTALNAPILNRDKNQFAEDVRMWTGSSRDGSSPSGEDTDTTCMNWTETGIGLEDLSPEGVVGQPASTIDWLSAPADARTRACSQELGLYCISR
jgi:hypothetical protein